MTFNPSNADGAQLIDILQYQMALNGYHLSDPSDATVEPGSSNLTVDVTVNSRARLGGPAESIGNESGLALPSPDPSDPRKALVYIDGAGNVQVEGGDPVPASPETEQRTRTFQPSVPIPDSSFVALAEVWIGAGASDVTSNDISSRTVPFMQGEGSGVNADLLRGSSDPTTPDVQFGLYPLSMDSSDRTDVYASFDRVADSYAAVSNAVLYEVLMGEMATSSSAMNSITTSDVALPLFLLSEHVADTVWTESVATEAIWELGNPTPPTTFTDGDVSIDISFRTTTAGGSSLRFDNNPGDSGTPTVTYTIIEEVDLSGVDTLEFESRMSNDIDYDYDWELTVDGETFSLHGQHGWTERSFDVSSITGMVSIGMDYQVRVSDTEHYWELKNLRFR